MRLSRYEHAARASHALCEASGPRSRRLRHWSAGSGLGEKLKIVLPDGSRKEMAVENTAIEDVLKCLGINPVEVIVAKNGRIVSEEETAGAGDELKIIMVVHGG